MVRYGDYFSRKTLHYCGVSPEQKMFEYNEMAYTGTQRMEKIRSDMLEIYQTLYRGHTEKNGENPKVDFTDLQVERKILAALYDSGIINNTEREYFRGQALQTMSEREQICVEEAKGVTETTKTQKVATREKILSARNIRQ